MTTLGSLRCLEVFFVLLQKHRASQLCLGLLHLYLPDGLSSNHFFVFWITNSQGRLEHTRAHFETLMFWRIHMQIHSGGLWLCTCIRGWEDICILITHQARLIGGVLELLLVFVRWSFTTTSALRITNSPETP